jgi:replicative DNA helicase
MSYSQQWTDSQASSQTLKTNVNSISVWDPSAYERLYLGWCLVNLQSSVLAEAICFVDQSWFADNNRRLIYKIVSDLVVDIADKRGVVLSKEKVAFLAQEESEEFSDWAESCIQDCIAAERSTVLTVDMLKNVCVAFWGIVKTKTVISGHLSEVDAMLNMKRFTSETPAQIEEKLQAAADIWSNSINQVEKTDELTEEQFIKELLTPHDDSKELFASSGLKAFDDHMLGGIAINDNTIAGKLITIAARPGVGKTALAASIVKGIAKEDRAAAFYTLEVPKRQIMQRFTCIHDYTTQFNNTGRIVEGIRVSQFPSRSFSSAQRDRILSYQGNISKNIFISDRLRQVEQIAAHVRMLKKRNENLSVVCIDHLGLLRVRRMDNIAYAVGEMTRCLKELATDLMLDIILMCQLNRESEKRDNKRPTLSDLRDSGRIEEDSDVVIGLYRDIEGAKQEREKMELIALKNRHGALGTTYANFNLPYGTVM